MYLHPGPDQKIWTACLDMLSRFWTKSRPVQTAFSHDPFFFAEAAPCCSIKVAPPRSHPPYCTQPLSAFEEDKGGGQQWVAAAVRVDAAHDG
jgi:hypothetical protein